MSLSTVSANDLISSRSLAAYVLNDAVDALISRQSFADSQRLNTGARLRHGEFVVHEREDYECGHEREDQQHGSNAALVPAEQPANPELHAQRKRHAGERSTKGIPS
jgi:hypothetical protein